jgi:hypothetical protein
MTRRVGLAPIVVAAALAAAPAASGGGPFATALNAPPPGLEAGRAWTARLNVVNCFGGPAKTGMEPWLAIRNAATGERLVFRIEPRGVETLYAVRVVFPSPGSWTYSVGDRAQTFRRYGPVEIRPAERESFPLLRAGGGALLAGAAGLALARRRRRNDL